MLRSHHVDVLRKVLYLHTKDQRQRRLLVEQLFEEYGKEAPPLNYEGEQAIVVEEIVRTLHNYGEISRGKPALSAFVEQVYARLSADNQSQVDEVLGEIFTPLEPLITEVLEPQGDHIFISYSHADATAFAQRLTQALRQLGFSVWIDTGDIAPGKHWDKEIERAIETCCALIFVMTPKGVESEVCNNEWNYALFTAKKPVIPLMAIKCKPPFNLTRIQYIDFTNIAFKLGIDRIHEHLNGILTNTSGISLPEIKSLPFTPEWILMEGGEFQVGDPDLINAPLREIKLPTYYISKTPVTQEQYEIFLSLKKPRHRIPYDDFFPAYSWDFNDRTPPSDKLNHPVVLVDASDAEAYCDWLTVYIEQELAKLPGEWRIALPSEYEWEHAARGTDSRLFPWGNGNPNKFLCNFEGLFDGTTPVSKFEKGESPYHVRDMSGNVWEWTRTIENNNRIVRGGCWSVGQATDTLRTAFRHFIPDETISDTVGFRVVITSLK